MWEVERVRDLECEGEVVEAILGLGVDWTRLCLRWPICRYEVRVEGDWCWSYILVGLAGGRRHFGDLAEEMSYSDRR